jgi:hypothetical protein
MYSGDLLDQGFPLALIKGPFSEYTGAASLFSLADATAQLIALIYYIPPRSLTNSVLSR